MAPRSGAWWTGARPASPSPNPTSSLTSTGGPPGGAAIPRSGARRTRSGSSPGCSRGSPPGPRSPSSSRTSTRGAATTRRSRTCSGPPTPTTPISPSTGSATTGAEAGPPPRETAVRVAAAAIAKKYLRERLGCTVRGWLAQLGPLRPARVDLDEVDRNPFFSPDPDLVPELERFMDALRKEGDSIGARVTVRAAGVPAASGSPSTASSTPSSRRLSWGSTRSRGSRSGPGSPRSSRRGPSTATRSARRGSSATTRAGSSAASRPVRTSSRSIALKPTSSLRLPGRSIDRSGEPVEVVTTGRHDPCVGLRATPIAEAMTALVLMDHWLRHRGQNADAPSAAPHIPPSAPDR